MSTGTESPKAIALKMTDAQRREYLQMLWNRYNAGTFDKADIYKVMLDIEVADAQVQASKASGANARYTLWSVIVATASALASLAVAIITATHH